MRRVVLLRHGRTAWNAERRFQGQLDPGLDEVGRMQAWEVAPLIAALAPGVLVSSDAQRAVQTAAAVATATGLPLATDARLRERSLGHWEGLTREEVAERFPQEFAEWAAGRDVTRRGGESREEVAGRALAALRELPGVGTAVLVTHSATAMALTTAVLGLPQRAHVLSPLANCHWSELVAEDSGQAWRLRSHNIGTPGGVVPLPVAIASEEATDADA